MLYEVITHTSAGRVPTDRGYRYYVDTLLQVGPLDPRERSRIEQTYRLDGLRVEERLREAGKVLSAISSYAGVVMVPRFNSTVFRHIEFLKLSQDKILVIFVSRSGLVQNKVIETDTPLSQHELEQIGNYLNRTLGGHSMQEIKARILREMAESYNFV